MADIRLQHPGRGQRVAIDSAVNIRLILDFALDQAVLERSGNDMVFTFADGGAIVVSDFYTRHTRTTLPEFEIQGQIVSGEQFFATLGGDLLPAAGPTATQTPEGGRHYAYEDAALAGGLTRLGGLDLRGEQGERPENALHTPNITITPPGTDAPPPPSAPAAGNPSPLPGDDTDKTPDDGDNDNTPGDGNTPDDGDDNNTPGGGDSGGGDNTPDDNDTPRYGDLSVNERGLRSQTDGDTSDRTVITDQHGHPVTEAMLGGDLDTINAGLTNGQLRFIDGALTYTLNAAIKHDQTRPGTGEGLSKQGDTLNLTINGKDHSIDVRIVDDAPGSDHTRYDTTINDGATSVSGVLDGFTFGADTWLGNDPAHGQDWRIQNAVKVEGAVMGRFTGSAAEPQWSYETPGGNTIIVRPDGSYTVFGGGINQPVKGESITLTFTDNDGDTHTLTLHITPVTSVGPTPPSGNTAHDVADTSNNVITGEDGKSSIITGDVAGHIPGQTVGNTHNLFIAVDASASMSDGLDNLGDAPGSRMQAVAEALHKLAGDLLDQQGDETLNVTIVSFTAGGTTPVELTLSLAAIRAMDPATLQQHLQNISTNGGTNFFPSLEAANTWFANAAISAGHDNTFILITDATGADNAAQDPTSQNRTVVDMLQRLEALGKHVNVEVISMLSSFQIAHADALQALHGSGSTSTLQQQYIALLAAEAAQRKYDSTADLPYTQRPLPPSDADWARADAAKAFFTQVLLGKGLAQEAIDAFFADCFKLGIAADYTTEHFALTQMGQSWQGMLGAFGDKADITFVGTPDEVHTALGGDKVVSLPLTFAPGSDLLIGGDKADILFGDADRASLTALVAATLGIDPAELTDARLFDTIRDHPDAFDRSDPAFAQLGKPDAADVLAGGKGNDLLYGQGGDDVLFGDGGAHSAADLAAQMHKLGMLPGGLDFNAGARLDDSILALNAALRGMDDNQLGDFAAWTEEAVAAFQALGDGNDLLYGGRGDDVIFGQGGDDILYGGDGRDLLFGGAGNDLLSGGAGDDKLYGGSGNDIIIYDRADSMIDGGAGIDFLVGVDKNSLDTLFGPDSPMHGVEVLILDNGASGGTPVVTSLTELARMGIKVTGDHIRLSDNWQADNSFHLSHDAPLPEGYQAFSHDDVTIILQKAALEHSLG